MIGTLVRLALALALMGIGITLGVIATVWSEMTNEFGR